MNRYQSHKEVEAFKIVNIVAMGHEALLVGDGDAHVTVNQAYMRKHQPKRDGYYVRYADGYESWSPAAAFEEGYTKIDA